MLKKLLKSLLGQSSSHHPYRKYSSSDMRHRKYPPQSHGHGQGHSYYGNSHYKKKHSSFSFFSS
ncbi:MAG TPA: hypothetical protein VE710_19220 [Candidatus Bathyarchaeia archaeon]|nr:hypothetical protein [Candidatus Bathyarchaeia archaeon]